MDCGRWEIIFKNLTLAEVCSDNIRVICVGMLIKNSKEIVTGGDAVLSSGIIIWQEGEKGFVPYALAEVFQKVSAVEIDDDFIGIRVLTFVNGNVNIAMRFKKVNAVRPPPGN